MYGFFKATLFPDGLLAARCVCEYGYCLVSAIFTGGVVECDNALTSTAYCVLLLAVV